MLLLLLRKVGQQGRELGILYKIYMVMSVVNCTAAIAKSCTVFQVSAYGGGTGIAVPLPLQSLGLPGYLELGILYKVNNHSHIACLQSNDWVNGGKLSMTVPHSALSCAFSHQNMTVFRTARLPWWLSVLHVWRSLARSLQQSCVALIMVSGHPLDMFRCTW